MNSVEKKLETVEVPVEAVEVAVRELGLLRLQTRDPALEPDECASMAEEGHMGPLARARVRLEEAARDAHQHGNREEAPTLRKAIGILDRVGEETGADTAPKDPLQNDVFRALRELQDVLGEAEGEEVGDR